LADLDSDALSLREPGAIPDQSRQNTELQTADHGTLAVFGNDEEDIRLAL
jgi:hypothetical protein